MNKKFLGGGGVIHDPSGTEIPRGWGGGSNQKNHPLEGYEYFLESHVVSWSQTLCLSSLGVCFSAQMTEKRN